MGRARRGASQVVVTTRSEGTRGFVIRHSELFRHSDGAYPPWRVIRHSQKAIQPARCRAGWRLDYSNLTCLRRVIRIAFAVDAVHAGWSGMTRVAERANIVVRVGVGLVEGERRHIALFDDVHVID